MVTHLHNVNDISFVDIGFIISVTGWKTNITEHLCVEFSTPAAMFVESRSKYFHEIIIIIVSMIFV